MKIEDLEPEGTKILVIPDEVPTETPGGLLKPDSVIEDEKHAKTWGKVIATGPAVMCEFDSGTKKLEIGDRVQFAKYGGTYISDSDDKMLCRVLYDVDIAVRIKPEVLKRQRKKTKRIS